MGPFETVSHRAYDDRSGLVTGLTGLNDKQLALALDMSHTLVVLDLYMLARAAPCLTDEGARQGLEIYRGVFVFRTERDHLFAAHPALCIGDRRLDSRDVLRL